MTRIRRLNLQGWLLRTIQETAEAADGLHAGFTGELDGAVDAIPADLALQKELIVHDRRQGLDVDLVVLVADLHPAAPRGKLPLVDALQLRSVRAFGDQDAFFTVGEAGRIQAQGPEGDALVLGGDHELELRAALGQPPGERHPAPRDPQHQEQSPLHATPFYSIIARTWGVGRSGPPRRPTPARRRPPLHADRASPAGTAAAPSARSRRTRPGRLPGRSPPRPSTPAPAPRRRRTRGARASPFPPGPAAGEPRRPSAAGARELRRPSAARAREHRRASGARARPLRPPSAARVGALRLPSRARPPRGVPALPAPGRAPEAAAGEVP